MGSGRGVKPTVRMLAEAARRDRDEPPELPAAPLGRRRVRVAGDVLDRTDAQGFVTAAPPWRTVQVAVWEVIGRHKDGCLRANGTCEFGIHGQNPGIDQARRA